MSWPDQRRLRAGDVTHCSDEAGAGWCRRGHCYQEPGWNGKQSSVNAALAVGTSTSTFIEPCDAECWLQIQSKKKQGVVLSHPPIKSAKLCRLWWFVVNTPGLIKLPCWASCPPHQLPTEIFTISSVSFPRPRRGLETNFINWYLQLSVHQTMDFILLATHTTHLDSFSCNI